MVNSIQRFINIIHHTNFLFLSRLLSSSNISNIKICIVYFIKQIKQHWCERNYTGNYIQIVRPELSGPIVGNLNVLIQFTDSDDDLFCSINYERSTWIFVFMDRHNKFNHPTVNILSIDNYIKLFQWYDKKGIAIRNGNIQRSELLLSLLQGYLSPKAQKW